VGEPQLAVTITTDAAGSVVLVEGRLDMNGRGTPTGWQDLARSALAESMGTMPGAPDGLRIWIEDHAGGGTGLVGGAAVRLVGDATGATVEVRLP
jgi:hypothetical protein